MRTIENSFGILPRPTSISFSGGRTSGYMLYRHLRSHDGLPTNHVITFCNTGKERDETLDFVQECGERWAVPIAWLEYTQATVAELTEKYTASNEYVAKKWATTMKRIRKRCPGSDAEFGDMAYHDWKVVNYKTAHRNGQPNAPFDKLLSWMKTLPNVVARACTAELKIRTMDRYLCSIRHWNRFDLIGIRADERHRTLEILANKPKRIDPLFPLVDCDVDEAEVLDFWSKQEFDLRLDTYEGNCDLCFLKSRGKIQRIMRERPESAQWWIEQERNMKARIGKGSGNVFRADRPSYATIRAGLGDPMLFDDEDIACACTEGGYRYLKSDEE